MELITDIPVRKTTSSRIHEVDFNNLDFGSLISDHMLVCDFRDGHWHTPRIVPYAPLNLEPATLALHYGQSVFEGMKAFRLPGGKVNVFRMHKHYRRFVQSLERMRMPVPPERLFREGLIQLISTDRAWVPGQEGSSLYIRPFIFASEARFGLKVADEYKFVIFTGPVPEVFARPISVKVETNYVRAAKGGTGAAKCAGNYGGALYPTKQARMEGYDQVLWTSGGQDPLIEESGMMNIMFVLGDKLLTPPLSDTILDGVTRDSLLVLAKDLGFSTGEKAVSVRELEQAFRNHSITEAFGAGTAAVVAPIERIHINGIDYRLPAYHAESLHNRLKRKLEYIRTGRDEDRYGWNEVF